MKLARRCLGRRFAVGLMSALPMCASLAGATPLNDVANVDVNAGSLVDALAELATQTGLQILYNPADLYTLRVPAVRGAFSGEAALTRMITGTGLRLNRLNERAVTLKRVVERAPPPPMREARSEADSGLKEVNNLKQDIHLQHLRVLY